jgi:division protein CdvB (Snf7/Vps24/ESCRT-III family)
VPEVHDVTLKIMQVKIKFMEAMDSLNKSVISGELDAGEANKIIDEIQLTLDKKKAG